MKTVFFGPFIGEFGWELLYWQGWVRKVCKEEYRGYRKIASSFPGREPFYPYVDEFWPHPQEILDYKISSRGYITDFWRNNFPRPEDRISSQERFEVEPIIRGLLERYKKVLPSDTLYYIPFKMNYYTKDNLWFGVNYPERPISNNDFVTKNIPFQYQCLEEILPTWRGKEFFRQIYNEGKNLIAIFPRYRRFRRPDKNWDQKNYDELIELLQQYCGDRYNIAIFGEPTGAFYAGGVPKNTLDLINIPDEVRMDVQVAALKRTVLALGSMSGAILFALACRVPAVTWGYLKQMPRYYQENFLGTDLIYYPRIKASPRKIFYFCSVILEKKFSLFVKIIPFINIINNAGLKTY
ncbi:MAG: hypothetical protein ACTSU6_07020, partial [Candidatus Njordarchaeales archaeon]